MSETPPEAEPSTPPISAGNSSAPNNSNSRFKRRGKKKGTTNYKFKGADEDMKEHVFQTCCEGHRKHSQFDKNIEQKNIRQASLMMCHNCLKSCLQIFEKPQCLSLLQSPMMALRTEQNSSSGSMK